jgi:uncharacterized protein
MRHIALSAAFGCATFGLASAAHAAWPPAEGRGSCAVSVQKDVPATMRDGTILRADVYTPKTDAKVPVILMRTQYGKSEAQVQPSRFQSPDWFASHCYIVVIQDIRGQGKSSGRFYEYRYDRDDGYDTVEWAARLPGADGRVGMYGSSYVGATQWLAATASPPSLKAIVPSNTASDYYDGWTYEDGAFRLAFIEPWMAETIASSAAANRGDAALALQLYTDGSNPSLMMHELPYDKVAAFHPGDAAVAPYFFDAVAHPLRDGYWKAFDIRSRYAKVQVPVLAFDGWYDSFITGALENFNGVQTQGGTPIARNNQRIVIGPWEHIAWGRPGSMVSPRLHVIGPVANSPVNELMLGWYDHFLKGIDNGIATGPRVDYFTMGENRWHTATAWPIPGTQYRTFHLASRMGANSVMGDGALLDVPPATAPGRPAPIKVAFGAAADPARLSAETDSFVYDPANPVPSLGGHSCCAWFSGSQGQFDQSALEQRGDILVYSTDPLSEPIDVTGPITVELYAATTAKDTDFTAKLVDVFPDGTAINVANGIQRAAVRDSLEHLSPVTPGAVTLYRIKVWPTSNLFAAGHRIRLEISSSDYPQFAPNPNTGAPFGTTSASIKATQTIYHDDAHPSVLILPVIPAGAAGAGADAAPLK